MQYVAIVGFYCFGGIATRQADMEINFHCGIVICWPVAWTGVLLCGCLGDRCLFMFNFPMDQLLSLQKVNYVSFNSCANKRVEMSISEMAIKHQWFDFDRLDSAIREELAPNLKVKATKHL